jgi:hypothetical protein
MPTSGALGLEGVDTMTRRKSGWFRESQRHSLASRGIETGRNRKLRTPRVVRKLKSFGATKKALEDKYTSDGIPAKEVVYERSMIGAQQHVVVDLIEELRKYSEVRQLDEAGMDILQNTIDYLNSVYNKLEEDHRANTEQLNQLDLSDDEINELWDEAVEERQE